MPLDEPATIGLPAAPPSEAAGDVLAASRRGRVSAWLGRWLGALVLGAAAIALRAALTPWLQDDLPFIFAFPALVAAALLVGAGPALGTLALCAFSPMVPAVAEAMGGALNWRQALVFVASAAPLVLGCAWFARRAPLHARPLPVSEGSTGSHAELWLRLLIVLALLLPTVFFASTAWQSRLAVYAAAEERVARSAVVAREQALRLLNMNAVVFDRMRERFDGAKVADSEAERAALQAWLERLAAALPDVHTLSVWDRDGRQIAISQPDDAHASLTAVDREYFKAQREADQGLYIAAPVASRLHPGQTRIVVSQRRVGPDGEFDGVYAIALDDKAFADFYRNLLRDERSGTVALFRRDGMMLAREPAPPRVAMALPATGPLMSRVRSGESEGQLTITSSVDGQRRLTAFRQVGDQPLYVAATVGEASVLAGWYRQVALLALFTFPTALALAWVSRLALRHTQRERLALERWRAETVKRAQAEDALRQTQRLEALGHLTGGVAHDVNNLLMVVSNNAYLLRRLLARDNGGAPPDSRVEKPIDAILRAVTTGARLTRQLLAFARRQALRPEVLDLQERLPTLVDLMRHSVPSSVRVDGQVEPGTARIQVDPAELELALINLAVNARDAMPEGGRIELHARDALPSEHEGLGRWVSIVVRDSGAGMPPEVVQRVFEPFFTTKEHGKGTGLGLSQVYGFCQQAGGVARISSRVGEGTTVQLVLPAAAGEPQASEPAPPLPSAEGRLLLVEDNAEVAEATEPMLTSWGYSVRAVRSGDAAKALLAQQQGGFELLLTDIVMPGSTDGLSLARHVRQRYGQIGIVLMTGHARETDKAIAEGFVVLQKPWTPPALAAALEQAHPRRRAA